MDFQENQAEASSKSEDIQQPKQFHGFAYHFWAAHVSVCVRACMLACLRACVLACLRACVLVCVCALVCLFSPTAESCGIFPQAAFREGGFRAGDTA